VDDVAAVLEDRSRDAGRRRHHLARVVRSGGGAGDSRDSLSGGSGQWTTIYEDLETG
jgi:hypothetical protein